MNIAIIVDEFPTLAETFIINQITGLLDLGHRVEVFSRFKPRDSKIHPDVERYGLIKKVSYLGTPRSKIMRLAKFIPLFVQNFHKDPRKILRSLNVFEYGKEVYSLRLFYQLVPFLKKKFDIMHCHFGPNGTVGINLKSVGVDGKVVTTFHGYDMSHLVMEKGRVFYTSLFAEGDLFLPVSEYWGQKLVDLGCCREKIAVHHMGIDLKKFRFSERKIEAGTPVVVLTVGRLVEKKGHAFLVKAVAEVIEKGRNVTCVIAGDGPLRKSLESLAWRLGVNDNIVFAGSIDQDEVLRLYEKAHLFVLPSITATDGDQEGIPVSLMEAQASGIPVISTYHSGIPEIVVDGQSGFLVPEKDYGAITEKLVYLIDHPETWADMGRSGRKIVESEFDIAGLNVRLEKIFRDLLKSEIQ